MKSIIDAIPAHQTQLLAEEFGAYLQRLTEVDLLSIQAILCLYMREVALGLKTVSLGDASNQFPYTLSRNQARAIAMLRGSNHQQLQDLMFFVGYTLRCRQEQKQAV